MIRTTLAKAPKPAMRRYMIITRTQKGGVWTACEVAGSKVEVNHRGDLAVSAGGKIVAAFASGSWISVRSEDDDKQNDG